MDTFLFENKLQLLQKTSPLIAYICLLKVLYMFSGGGTSLNRRGCTPGSPQYIVHPCENGPTGLRPLRVVYGYLLY